MHPHVLSHGAEGCVSTWQVYPFWEGEDTSGVSWLQVLFTNCKSRPEHQQSRNCRKTKEGVYLISFGDKWEQNNLFFKDQPNTLDVL